MDIKEQFKCTNNGYRFGYIFSFYFFNILKPFHSKNLVADNSVKWDLNVKSKKNNKLIFNRKRNFILRGKHLSDKKVWSGFGY